MKTFVPEYQLNFFELHTDKEGIVQYVWKMGLPDQPYRSTTTENKEAFRLISEGMKTLLKTGKICSCTSCK